MLQFYSCSIQSDSSSSVTTGSQNSTVQRRKSDLAASLNSLQSVWL